MFKITYNKIIIFSGVTSLEIFIILNIFFIAIVIVEDVVVSMVAPRRLRRNGAPLLQVEEPVVIEMRPLRTDGMTK